MAFTFTQLRPALSIDRIVTVHYFEYSADYDFPGESHDFWEFLYVDRGTVSVTADQRHFSLQKDQIIFHKPGEFHSVRAGGSPPNLVVAAFECSSPAMDFFSEKILRVDPDLRVNLQHIVREARLAFADDLNDPQLTGLTRRESPEFGSEQLIGLFLQQLLIELLRRGSGQTHASSRLATPLEFAPCYEDGPVFRLLTDYMERNIGKPLRLEELCRDNLISRSAAQKLFREKTGGGVMEYFSGMKIDHAKFLIRQRQMNFTQIAQALGYSSIHYLSRQFRQRTGMTLTEYSRCVL